MYWHFRHCQRASQMVTHRTVCSTSSRRPRRRSVGRKQPRSPQRLHNCRKQTRSALCRHGLVVLFDFNYSCRAGQFDTDGEIFLNRRSEGCRKRASLLHFNAPTDHRNVENRGGVLMNLTGRGPGRDKGGVQSGRITRDFSRLFRSGKLVRRKLVRRRLFMEPDNDLRTASCLVVETKEIARKEYRKRNEIRPSRSSMLVHTAPT